MALKVPQAPGLVLVLGVIAHPLGAEGYDFLVSVGVHERRVPLLFGFMGRLDRFQT